MTKNKTKEEFGAAEWGRTLNIQRGCKNACLFCYAAHGAIVRFSKMPCFFHWCHSCELYPKKIEKGYRKVSERYMFPTTHDIYPANYLPYSKVLRKVVQAGNEVLITTKPRLQIIKQIIDDFKDFREQIQFRFTIGSINQAVIDRWELYSPKVSERLASISYAWAHEWKTSISIEPYLDANVLDTISRVQPYSTESIWVGFMNSRAIPTSQGRELFDKYLKPINNLGFIQQHVNEWEKAAKGLLRLKYKVRKQLSENKSQTILQVNG